MRMFVDCVGTILPLLAKFSFPQGKEKKIDDM